MKIPLSSPNHRFDPATLLFLTSIVLTVFIYGAAVGRYQIFPFPLIQFTWGSVQQVFAERETILGTRPTFVLKQARRTGAGVTRVNKEAASPGLTLLGGFFDKDLEFRLIGLDGTIVRRWPARFRDVFPDASHVKPADHIPQTNWNVGIQGASMLRDGSLLFNFEGLGLVKLDRCGAVQWTLPRMTSHSVHPAEDGGFWLPSTRYVEGGEGFPGLTPPFTEDTILRVSDNGEVLEEISVPGLFFENDLEALLFANGLEEIRVADKMDLTHLNDVEELTRGMAPHFPDFAAGDLLISLRNYNMLMVVDPRTRKVKWHQTGPWIKQHDPDFEPTGRITVFNNNSDGTETGSILGGSTILEVDPRTGKTHIQYGDGPDQDLFTHVRGRHQTLPNGNQLITESDFGRVLEVDEQGNIVWEYINRFDAESVAVIGIAHRYPEGYFTVDDWTCG